MRPILHGDVSSAARALLMLAPGVREGFCRRMIREAVHADRYMRQTGRMHPFWGNGSLMAAARRRPLAAEPGFDDPDYCRCFEIVLSGLIAHHLGARP